jgi:2-hydroxy-6-oxonona-2,4-dienedioate hydrolase
MRRTGWWLLTASLAIVGGSGLVFLSYNSDISRARAAVSNGAQVANTAAGPIQYSETGNGIPLLSVHGAGGGFDQGLANVVDLVREERTYGKDPERHPG